MKKQLTFLCALLFLMAGAVNAQVTQTNTQFPNPGFEHWDVHSASCAGEGLFSGCSYPGYNYVPTFWHTFDEINLAAGRANHHIRYGSSNTLTPTGTYSYNPNKVHSGDYSIGLVVHSIVGVKANGTMTTGVTYVGNMLNAGDAANYNYDNNNNTSYTNFGNGKFNFPFIGCPDSLSMYYQTNWTSPSVKPMIKVFGHIELPFYDKANGDLSPTENIIFQAIPVFPTSNGSWARGVCVLTYNTTNFADNGDNNYTTLSRPEYLLASPSTSQSAGSGNAGDEFIMDDLYFIYDKGLATVTIDGVASNDALSTFNAAEWLTHEPSRTYDNLGNPSFNNSGTSTWNYPTTISCTNIPQVTATPKSKLITEFTVTQANAENGYKATIHVKHNDNSTFDYYIQFTAPEPPTITLNNGGVYTACDGDDITVTASGATSYEWSGGLGNTATVHPTTSGTYTVTGTASNGCTGTATATVTVNPLPSVTLSSDSSQTVCAGTAINNITATIGGGSASASGLPGLSFNNGVISGTPNGTSEYTITVTSTYTPSCGTATASGIITVNPAPTATLSQNAVTACAGTAITPITVTTSGGNVTMSLPSGLTYSDETNEISGIPNEGGSITITNTGDCGTANASCTVTVNPSPSVTLSNNKNQTLCNSSEFTPITVSYSGGNINVSGLNNTGLSYSGGQISGSPTPGSHTYYVTVASSSCGTVSDTGTVTVNSSPTVTLSPSSFSVCQNAAVEGLSVSPFNNTTQVSGLPAGLSFDNTTGQIIGNPTAVGTFNISVTTTTNCGDAQTNGTITVKPLPTVTLSNSNIEVCEGSAISPVTVTATNCGNSNAVTLSNGLQFSGLSSNTGTISGTPTTAGAFTVTVNSNNQCGSASADGTVTIKSKPTVNINGPASICQGVSETFKAEGNFTSCSWEDNSTDAARQIVSNQPGQHTYSVTVTGSNGCTNSESTTVTVQASPAEPNATVANNTNCSNPNGSITVTSPTGNYTYSINGTDFQTETTFTGLNAGNYTLTVKNNAGCTNSKEYTITSVGSTVTAQAQAQNPCVGGNLTLNGSSNASSGVTYSWTAPNGTTYDGQNPTIENVTTTDNGVYTLTVTETATGCSSTATVTVTVKEQPTVSISANPSVCPGANLNIMVDGQNGTLSATGLPNGVTLSNGFITGSISTPGTYNYTISNTSDCGTATADGSITVYELPAITFTGTPSFCEGSSTTIGVEETYNSYIWSNNNSNSSITVSAAGNYSVTVTDSHNCQNNATQTVTMNSLPAAPTFNVTDNTNCDPFNGVITVTAPVGTGFTYSIDGTDFQESPVFDGLESDDYTITVQDGNGCISSEDAFVDDSAVPVQEIITVNAINSYEWNGTTYTESGDYIKKFTAANGCDSTVTLHLTITSSVTNDITATACDSYTWDGVTYNTTGDYSKTYTAESGVDSVVTLHLTILKPNAGTVTISGNDAICQSKSAELTASVDGNNGNVTYLWNTNETDAYITVKPTATTDYSVTATATLTANEVTCTATAEATFTVTVNMPTTSTETVTACESYEWHDNIYTASTNTPTWTTTNAAGCDSIVTLNLTINHSTNGTETVTACDSYEWHGTTYTASTNTPTWTTTNAAGCDSVVTLNLTINHSTTGIEEVTACDSYVWHGNTYTASTNTPTWTTTNAAGCDSVVTLNLTINHSTTSTETVTACESYEWHGTTYTESTNTPTYTTTNAAGCDSVVTLNLTINKPANQAYRVTRCETYTWTNGDGETYTQSGTHTYAHTDENGCEQVDTLYLTINPLPVVEIIGDTSFCEGASTTLTATAGYTYLWKDGSTNQSITVTESGDYTVTVTDGNNCQNTDTIHVNKLARPSAPILSATDNTSCTTPNGVITVTNAADGLTYSIDGTNFSSATTFSGLNAGDFTITVKNENGCVNTASITVNTAGNTVEATATANTPCAGGELQLTATTETSNATFAWSGPNGYTSNVQNPTRTNANADMNGNYTLTVTDPATSCSKTTTVTVTVNTPAVTLADITGKTACAGGNVTLNATLTGTPAGEVSYSWNGPDGFTSNNQNITLNNITAAQGGDYTVVATATQTINSTTCLATDTKTVNVTVNMPTTGVDEKTACEVFTWIDNVTYTESTNEPTITLQAANGCDSVVTLHLTIHKPVHQAYTVTAYDSYTWTDGNNQTYTTSGDHLYSHPDDNGCTQVDTLHLTIHYSASNEFSATACESYTWNDSVYTTSGDYVQHLKTVDNADSTVTLHLTVNYGTHNAETMVACESYVWHGTTYNTSGNYTYDYNNADGCESTDTLHLTINNPQHQAYTETAYDSYTWTAGNGQTYEASGDYLYSHQDANGCTQVDTLHLTVIHSASNEFSATACESYTWNGSTYTTSGDYVQTFKTVDNADSTVTLHLTIHHGTHNAETAVACESYVWHGTTYNTSGDYTYDYNNADGCESTDTLHLTINKPQHQAYTQTAYDSYTWTDGNGQTYEESGDYLHSHQDANGCTQVDTLHLTIFYSSSYEFSASACESYEWDGQTYTASGDYERNYTDQNGADSTVTLHLTIHHGTHNAETAVACESYVWHGTTYNTSGDYTYDYNNADGCESTDTLHLTINKPQHQAYTQTAYDSYTWTDGNGQTYEESGDYLHSHQDANGCTQVDTLHLTVIHSTSNEFSETACESYTWNGSTYTTSGDYEQTFTAASGADSIVTLHLTILKPNAGTLTISGDNAICQGGSTELTASVNGNNGNVTYAWNTNETGASITVNEGGNYTVVATATLTSNDVTCTATAEETFSVTVNTPTTGDTTATACESFDWYEQTITESGEYTHTFTGANVNGCDSIVTLYITINHNVTGDTTAVECNSFDWYDHTNITESCDNLTHTFQTANGCDSIVTLHLTILKPTAGTISIEGENTICQGENTQLTASVSGNNGSVSYSWDNQATTASITVKPTTTTDYTVTATATLTEGEATCIATTEATITVTVNQPTYGDDEQTTCEEEFTWIDGNTYYESTNTPIWTTTNAAGCDSVVTLHLTIYEPQHQAFYVTKCESYTWEDGNGETYTESGEYLHRHLDDNGCKQVDTLHLTINHGTHQSFNVEACEEYEWHNVHYTESGIYTYQHETTTDGCPDVDTLHLTINKPVEKDTTIQVCFFPYTFMGKEYTEPTTDDILISKADGSCDSILYHLSVEIISSLTVEGHEYPIVKIGSDCWFAENLRTTEGLSNVSAYNDDETNVELFGRLYNWYDAIGETQPDGAKAPASDATASACPDGWTIPSVADFENLVAAAGDDINKLKSPDASTWVMGLAGSSDGIGFNAPAAGFYNPASQQFERLLLTSQYWTSTSGSTEDEMISFEISYYCSHSLFNSTNKETKLSIRCIKVKE